MKKIVFIGTVISSYHALEELLINKVPVAGVFTLDKEYIGSVSDYADLKPLCQEYNVPCYTFRNVNDAEVIDKLKELHPDYVFVIGLSQLVKREILDLPSLGCIGAHPSLLPKGRGRASLPWTIINEDQESGMSVFFLEDGPDSGDIIKQKRYAVSPSETATTLYEKTIKNLREIMKEIAPDLKKGTITAVAQDEKLATYTTKRVPTDGFINWETMSTHEIDKLIRASTAPYPGAYTYYKKKKLIIWSAAKEESNEFVAIPGQVLKITKDGAVWIKTIDGILALEEVTFDKKKGKAADFVKAVGHKLGINMAELVEELLT